MRFHCEETQAGEMPQTRSHPIRQLEHNRNYRVQASGCNTHGTQPYNVDQVRQCIRSTYLALATLVAGQDGAIPLTLCKLYSLSVLPKALFGCELWHNISRSDMRQIGIAHHFCLKHSQGFRRDTRSDIVKGMLGITSIEAYIDKQKLAFFGSVFRTPPTDLVNQLITYRLFNYYYY